MLGAIIHGDPMLKSIVIVGVLILAVVLIRSMRPGSGETASSGEPREGDEPEAVEHPDISIDQANVPQDLRDLIPFAEQWGIGDDDIRSRYEDTVSGEEKERFRAALAGRTTRVTEWLDSFEDGMLSEEAGTFMYMLEALDEMGIWPD